MNCFNNQNLFKNEQKTSMKIILSNSLPDMSRVLKDLLQTVHL